MTRVRSQAHHRAWRPYRWRGYVLGLVVGILAGGILGPVVTVSVAFALGLAGSRSIR